MKRIRDGTSPVGREMRTVTRADWRKDEQRSAVPATSGYYDASCGERLESRHRVASRGDAETRATLSAKGADRLGALCVGALLRRARRWNRHQGVVQRLNFDCGRQHGTERNHLQDAEWQR